MTQSTHSFQTFLKREYFVYYAFLAVMAFFSITLSDTGFMSWTNLMNIIRQTTPVTIMAVGLTFALACGHIDLSIGSVVALSALVAAVLLETYHPLIAVLAGLGVGVIIGLINGVLIEWLKVNSLLVTLGTMGVVAGIARMLTNLNAVPIVNDDFNFIFGSGNIGPISTLLIWTVIVVAVAYVVLNKTRYGTHLLAVGDNAKASYAVGIQVVRVRITALVITSVAAALAGLLYAGRLNGARYTLGEADLLTVIAAVAIGGTSLFGGKASIIGAIIGSWMMGVINNGFILYGFSTNEQMIARGMILIIAVAIGAREDRK